MATPALTYREQIQSADLAAIDRIVRSSGFFSAEEIDLACELACEKLSEGAACSYQFLFIEDRDLVWGYSCFGQIPATVASYDLYWIAVDDHLRARGVGKQLMQKTEDMVRSRGGRNIYAETSSRNQYQTTRKFYERCGYIREALLKDFYAPDDGKIIYSKVVV
jgi:ribosomal protein S18 acetylase RimI-like enzyme